MSRASRTVERSPVMRRTGTSATENPWRSTRWSTSMSNANRSTRPRPNTVLATSERNALSPHWVSWGWLSKTPMARRLMARLPRPRSAPALRTLTVSGWRRLPTATSQPVSTSPITVRS